MDKILLIRHNKNEALGSEQKQVDFGGKSLSRREREFTENETPFLPLLARGQVQAILMGQRWCWGKKAIFWVHENRILSPG